ncbi:protein TonB [Roseateles sp. YR242]|uniref:energy transducer TonB n=1 Tax=Roseateles sp. YR242 TaxID=1855305 RepID=UPI0008C23A6E|nr:energy transducer TonB [Roseateles sp. YR242]SEK55707.1 protein TonB [Roseateles sp. YR242]
MNTRWSGGLATVGIHGLLILALIGVMHRAPVVPAVPPALLLVSARPVVAPAAPMPARVVPAMPDAMRALPDLPTVAIPNIVMTSLVETSAPPERPPASTDAQAPMTVAMATGVAPGARSIPTAEPTGAGTAPRPDVPPPQEQPAALPANHRECSDQQTARHYPAMLRERGVQGLVRLRVKVDENGRAAEVVVANGSGFRLLDEAARRVAESCPYVPARRGDQRLASWIEYAVRFALQPASSASL